MNREIKFRVWDKIGKCFRFDQKLGLGEGELYYVTDSRYLQLIEITENYVIQQFTGLKDLKGNDIFEGDILKFSWRHEHDDTEEWTGEVFWDLKIAAFLISREGQWNIMEITNPEIIGNIFEHPNLPE